MESNHAVAQNKWLEKTSTSISMVILALEFAAPWARILHNQASRGV